MLICKEKLNTAEGYKADRRYIALASEVLPTRRQREDNRLAFGSDNGPDAMAV
jgi:hypothetical protein